MRGLVIINLLPLITYIQCRDLFLTFASKVPTSTFQCLKQKNLTQISLLYTYDNAGVNPMTVQDITNAVNAGLIVDAIFIADREQSIQTQIMNMRKNFQMKIVGKFWMLPYGNWDRYSSGENCRYLGEFVGALRALGLEVGIWTDNQFWIYKLDPQNICSQISNILLLWWEPLDEQDDHQPNFNSYQQFGGWKEPYLKQYGRASACGINFYVSYYR